MAEINLPMLLSFSDMVTTVFNERMATAPSVYARFSMDVPSTGRANVYPRMEDIPGLREWIGERVIHSLEGKAYEIVNKDFEATLGIDRNDFDDDQLGLYGPIIAQMGKNAAELPDKLSIGLLAVGESAMGYDGQPFFGNTHTSYNVSGSPFSYSNLQMPTGTDVAGPAWYLICTTEAFRPVIVQRRRPFVLTPRMNLQDPTVFMLKKFLWGTDGRMNAGYGMWQTIIKSYAPLTPYYYALARTMMASQHRRDGTPYGVRPNLVMVPTSLIAKAKTLLVGEITDATTNPWKGDAEVLETQWLN